MHYYYIKAITQTGDLQPKIKNNSPKIYHLEQSQWNHRLSQDQILVKEEKDWWVVEYPSVFGSLSSWW